jgi:hypothetical protein
MPRPQWIGSFSTKTANTKRVDIEIVNLDPNNPLPNTRILLYCIDASRVGHIIWQTMIAGQWVSLLQPPPYHVYDMGMLGHPHAPMLVNLHVAAGGTHSLFLANWTHNMVLNIDPLQVYTYFQYQPPPIPGHAIVQPIRFRRLRFIQQIQSSTLALDIQ